MMQAAARGWRDAGRPGAIVNIVLTVDRGMPGVAHSTAARAGVIGLSKTVAVEWAEHGIRVNCIAPGPILTEGMRVYPPETFARIPRMNPMMRFGDPWDIADAAVYLSTPASKFVTGETLTVDGGATLGGEFWLIEKPEHFG
jgi:citronellol/citronellal dehydrogenase